MAPSLVASVLRSILLPPALGWIPATPDACCGPSHLGPSVRDRLRAGLRGFPPGCSSSGAVASASQVLVRQAQGPEFRSSAHISKLGVVVYAGNPNAGRGIDSILGD